MVRKNYDIIAVLEFITASWLLLFWVVFFSLRLVPQNGLSRHFAYQNAFPLVDVILGFVLLIAGFTLLKGKKSGQVLSLVCAVCLILLGILDFSFTWQNGVYSISMIDMISNGAINLWCVVFGLYVILKLREA